MRARLDKRLLTAAQSKAIDTRAQKRFGMPVVLLMENAGSAVAREAAASLKDKKAGIAVFCGKGNNGGDGFCAARHLLTAGLRPQVFLAGKAREVKNEEARLNLRILLKLGCPVVEVSERNLALVRRRLKMCACIIDALLGVGVRGAAGGIYKTLIEAINASGAIVIAVDIPSGLDATSGKAPGVCVKADKTVTFVARKRGMSLRSGPALCGKVIVAKLGIDL